MAKRKTTDPGIGELLALQGELIQASQEWSRGAEPGDDVDALRHAAIRINHSRYAELIPTYRMLAEELDLLGEVELDTIVNNLMFSDDLFKSYDPASLESLDFSAMTEWLATVFTHPIHLDGDGIESLHGWRTCLRAAGVYLTYSSGTSGRMSFVPRDPLTWNALRRNSRTYADRNWFFGPDGRTRKFDCLVAGPRGDGMGIQGAANGLVQLAECSHYLFDAELTDDVVREFGAGNSPAHAKQATDAFLQAANAATGEPYHRACEFILRGIDSERPLVIFGAPFQVRRLCEQVSDRCGKLELSPGSTLVTGGGWKSFQGERIQRRQLHELIQGVFRISPEAIIDAYSTAELNCAFVSCAELRYHIPPLIEPVVLDEAFLGASNEEGFGTLGFLDPFATSYPGFVITGDLGHLRRGRCPCGLAGWFVDGEIGRAEGREIKGCGGVMASIRA